MLIILMYTQLKKNSSTGYILEVDLKYPEKLHKLHNDYLLAPEKLAIPYGMPNYCQKLLLNME